MERVLRDCSHIMSAAKGDGGEGGMENLTKAHMKIMGRVGGGVTKLR